MPVLTSLHTSRKAIRVVMLDRLPRRFGRRTLPVGVQQGDVVGGAWVAMTGLGVASRVRTEEAMMLGRFGEQYRAYMRRTGRLFPRIVPMRETQA